MRKAPVNKIIKFSAVDGPGNRTAIFLQGCNFNCKYCHNPETRALCIGCGLCVEKCPAGALSLGTPDPAAKPGMPGYQKVPVFDPTKCVACDTCIHVCPNNASPRIRWMNPEEVYEEVKKQVPFIRGITVAGGECTLYPGFPRLSEELCKMGFLVSIMSNAGAYTEEIRDVFRRYPPNSAGITLAAVIGLLLICFLPMKKTGISSDRHCSNGDHQ
jgi:pyruvate formate lyase activating enzyme